MARVLSFFVKMNELSVPGREMCRYATIYKRSRWSQLLTTLHNAPTRPQPRGTRSQTNDLNDPARPQPDTRPQILPRMSSVTSVATASPWQALPTKLKLMLFKYCIVTNDYFTVDEHYDYLDELLNIATSNRELHDLALAMYYSKNQLFPHTDIVDVYDQNSRSTISYPNPAIAHWVRKLVVCLSVPIWNNVSPDNRPCGHWELLVGDRSDWVDYVDLSKFELILCPIEDWWCPAS
jgi:hypothetical protein